jgi:hypothetical protein
MPNPTVVNAARQTLKDQRPVVAKEERALATADAGTLYTGVAGPVGPAGAAGTTGATGPTGPTGH